jgi:putative salt-induced outer membrane protein YdiY
MPFAQSVIILQLKNGDRLSGTIVNEDTNQVTLKTTWSPAVVVSTSEIRSRTTNAPAPPPITAPTPGTAKVTTPTPVPPKSPKHWTGEVQLGVDLLFSERTRQLYSGRAKVSYAHGRFRNLADYQFTYGHTDGVLSDNRMSGSLKTDYDLTRRIYVYNLGGAGYDEPRRVDFRYELGPGLGYQLVKRTNFVVKAESGVNYQTEFRADDTRSEVFFGRFAEDVAWKVTSKLSVDEKFEFFPALANWKQYRFRFESNLRYALMNNFSFVVTVSDQYDSAPAEGVPPNDLQVRSAIGLKF